jgi:hypothetical protein
MRGEAGLRGARRPAVADLRNVSIGIRFAGGQWEPLPC